MNRGEGSEHRNRFYAEPFSLIFYLFEELKLQIYEIHARNFAESLAL